MRERPILFSGPMVRAILEGRKTQTRRIVKPQPPAWAKYPQLTSDGWEWTDRDVDADDLRHWPDYYKPMPCPYGVPGDWLWVRETWIKCRAVSSKASQRTLSARYKADEGVEHGALLNVGWTPSIHMPRWASRITLEIVSVRVEKVQEISGRDVQAEGLDTALVVNPVADFARLWDSINAKRAPWEANPWVWVIEFRRVA